MKNIACIPLLLHFVTLNVSDCYSQPAFTIQNDRYDTFGKVPGNYRNGVDSLKILYVSIIIYKSRHDGNYPENLGKMLADISSFPSAYGKKTAPEVTSGFKNPDSQFSDSSTARKRPDRMNEFFVLGKRPDGSLIGGPKLHNTEEVLSYSPTYYHRNYKSTKDDFTYNPVGFLLVLRGSGEVEKISYDQVFFHPHESTNAYSIFPNQPGIPFDVLTYDEYFTGTTTTPAPRGKPMKENQIEPTPDNGGPESLVQMSRYLFYPNYYGVDREDLWKHFDPALPEFTLSDIQTGATNLGIETQVQKLPLSHLQKSSSSALLFLKDDGRIVALTALDDDRAVIIDRGLTRNVERSVLEKRYSGEALTPTKALTQQAGIVADDAVRALQLPSLEAEVPQQFVLRNTGKVPITLQLEYPLLGVTESKLSKDTLAPGETATLDLKVKWRSILKAPTQNVLVSLQTSDPIVPRLQLAILLSPPPAATQ